MKKLITAICLLLLYQGYSKAQTKTPPNSDVVTMAKAYFLLNINTKHYNPDEAIKLYKSVAAKGNGKAMNAIGNIYAFGIGREIDNEEAFRWYQQAVEANYPQACLNLGLMYKMGYGTPQDFEKAYQTFEKGASLNELTSVYYKGYMLYKGLGCPQNYQKAMENFKYGASKGRTGSAFMLGLCYRNGYGTKINLDSARYWLQRSAKGGYQQAINELKDINAENILAQATKSAVTVLTREDVKDAPQKVQELKQSITPADLKGSFMGYAVQYDWSGEHIISKNKLALDLNGDNGNVTGILSENDSLNIPIKAILTDTSLVFTETTYKKTTHYNPETPVTFEFKNAKLQLTHFQGESYLTGNIQLWNNDLKEPEKLIYVSLKSQSKSSAGIVASKVNSNELKPLNTQESVATAFTAYPNPFRHQLNLSFYLKQSGKIDIILSDLSGRAVYKKTGIAMQQGVQTFSIEDYHLSAGVYTVTLAHAGLTQSLTVIKQ